MLSSKERLFAGKLSEEYDVLRVVCPSILTISSMVGQALANTFAGKSPTVFEIGCGTGITTSSIFDACPDAQVSSVDSEPNMVRQVSVNLATHIMAGRLIVEEADALSALRLLPSDSLDAVASGYAIHNFQNIYRNEVLREIHRVLKDDGLFVNGDRYAIDVPREHVATVQSELRGWFASFASLGRLDLLEEWVVHLLSDECSSRIMRLRPSLDVMSHVGFSTSITYREGVNALVVGVKTPDRT